MAALDRMTTSRIPAVPPADIRGAVDALVDGDVITREQAQAVLAAIEEAAPAGPAGPAPDHGRLPELAGYLGAALVAGGVVVVLVRSWTTLGPAGRTAGLAAIALALAVAGAVLAGRRPLAADGGDRPGGWDVRRRLVSCVWSLAAWSAGAAVASAVQGAEGRWALALGGTAGLLSLAAYRRAPSAVGQLSLWAAVVALWDAGVSFADLDAGPAGAALVAVGAGWAALGLTGVLRERQTALALSAVAGLMGAQLAVTADSHLLGHLLTAGVAAGGLAVHLRTRAWPALAGGVVAAGLLVAEVTHDLTGATLAVAAAVVLTGLALVLVSALGLRSKTPA
jgi:hypothetical protein